VIGEVATDRGRSTLAAKAGCERLGDEHARRARHCLHRRVGQHLIAAQRDVQLVVVVDVAVGIEAEQPNCFGAERRRRIARVVGAGAVRARGLRGLSPLDGRCGAAIAAVLPAEIDRTVVLHEGDRGACERRASPRGAVEAVDELTRRARRDTVAGAVIGSAVQAGVQLVVAVHVAVEVEAEQVHRCAVERRHRARVAGANTGRATDGSGVTPLRRRRRARIAAIAPAEIRAAVLADRLAGECLDRRARDELRRRHVGRELFGRARRDRHTRVGSGGIGVRRRIESTLARVRARDEHHDGEPDYAHRIDRN